MNLSISPARALTACCALLIAAQWLGINPGGMAIPGPIGTAAAQSVPAQTRTVLGSTEVREQAAEIAAVKKLQQSRRPDQALRAARRAVRKFPANVQLRFLLGVTLSDAGKPEEAIETFEALTRDHPELAEPYNNLAVLHASNGDLDAARDALIAAIRVVPDYTLALTNLGDVYLRMAERSYATAAESGDQTPLLKRKLTRARAVVESLTADR
jgi:Flp pilus assembly protein TadD